MAAATADGIGRIGRKSVLLIALIALQAFCVAFFSTDFLLEDLQQFGTSLGASIHVVLEFLANLALMAAVVVEMRYLRQVLARQAHAERALSIASGALHEVMEGYFRQWGLTPSEADIAAFTIKGFSIAEIAGLRGTAEGTVKTHLNAIYRKSGLAGRGQLVSILIEDLVRPDFAAHPGAPHPRARGGGAHTGAAGEVQERG